MPSSQDRRARTRVTPAMPMFFWVWAYAMTQESGSNGADIRSELMSAISGTPVSGNWRNWVPSTVLLEIRWQYRASGRARIDATSGT
jgi:hypothetical protein